MLSLRLTKDFNASEGSSREEIRGVLNSVKQEAQKWRNLRKGLPPRGVCIALSK